MPDHQSGSNFCPRPYPGETTPGSGVRNRTPPIGFVLAVGAGGAIGAALRHALVLAFPRDTGTFPLVTFAENVSGSFMLGVVLIALLRAPRAAGRWRPFLATGILGSFTTFSNVSVEIVNLTATGAPATATLYIGVSVAAGLGAAVLGIMLGASVMHRMRGL
ncbi:MAG TPA: CrcB family protein [Longimicrobiales bacterium]|nr:CrcB family protein [Longimicrobiales bacterium]